MSDADFQSEATELVRIDRANSPVVVERNRRRMRHVAPKLLRLAGKIPFADDLAAAYFCALDPLTPSRVKGVLLAALAYFVVPTDIVPDFILALGFSDDATVLTAAIGVVGMHIKPRHRRAARKFLGMEEPPGFVED